MSEHTGSHHPPFVFPQYKSSLRRGPARPLFDLGALNPGPPSGAGIEAGPGLTEAIPINANPRGDASTESGACLGGRFTLGELDHDLLRNARHSGEPLGERIVVSGRVLDDRGNPLAGALVEIWQANASGRYVHKADSHDAPLDPNFLGAGRCLAGRDGRYRFLTIRPGAYPWKNHHNAWRPQHIHFSVLGACPAHRLVTQMYFPGDPLLEFDPIFESAPPKARDRLIAKFDWTTTEPDIALGYVFDIVVTGAADSGRNRREAARNERP